LTTRRQPGDYRKKTVFSLTGKGPPGRKKGPDGKKTLDKFGFMGIMDREVIKKFGLFHGSYGTISILYF
jgi:hypothetical protein